MASPSVSQGLEVTGLSESIRALKKWDASAAKEAVGVFREETKRVQKVARGDARPHASAPSRTGWIGRQASARSAGLKVSGASNRRAWATELGMHRAYVFGRLTVQSALSRRQFQRYQGFPAADIDKGDAGYVVRPAIREELPRIIETLADEILELWDRLADAAGVPRRGMI